MKRFGKYLKKCIDIRNWKRQTKTGAAICVAVVVVMIVLAAVKPSEQEMLSHTSPAMQKMIEKDAESSRKRVTVTYNSLWVINYLSLSSSGANVMSEKYVGFAGHVYSADSGAMEVTGQMVNYTYRMLGCGENVLHGAKLTSNSQCAII